MAQPRMPELADLVRRHYHRFPAETWERTRKALDNPEPYRLFVHIEDLISTRQIDEALRGNSDLRGLVAELYGERYAWLHDADLGAARWEAYQERSIEARTAEAKEAEKDPAASEKRKRDIMIGKIVEGGADVERWARVLGYEGVVFPPHEIQAAAERARAQYVDLDGEGLYGYGVGEEREDIGGLDETACIDGPDGTYGPCSYADMVDGVTEELPLPPTVPKAPAEGGKAPRNPFTTEWRARDAPGGKKWPATFDPYYSSNQFIRRTTKYKLPELSQISDDEDSEEEPAASDTPAAANQQHPPDSSMPPPTGVVAQASGVTEVQTVSSTRARRRKQQSGNPPGSRLQVPRYPGQVEGAATGATTIPQGFTAINNPASSNQAARTSPPQPRPPVIPSFTISTRTGVKHGEAAERRPTTIDPTRPSNTITGTTSTSHTSQFERAISSHHSPVPASSLGPPPTERRIFTPPREEIPLSPASPDTPSQTPTDPDIEMIDVEDEDETTADLIAKPFDENWLVNWLKRDHLTAAEDLQMMDYNGWRIHSPKVQLIRIKNFLSDEDIDRTLDWERKFAEIGEFLQYCLRMEGSQERDWYPDLRQCINMLHTHWVFEQHHYGEKKLVVDFPELKSTSTRLPPLPDGRSIVVERMPKEEVRPRYLLHRVPESVQDVDYQIPGPLLRKTFLTWFRQDGNLVWAADPGGETPGSGQRGRVFRYEPDFNMALTEDRWFVKGMDGGPETTARDLRADANFYILNTEYIAGEVTQIDDGGKTHQQQKLYPEGEVQQRFARYRGAKRAALQQCLSHFDSVENVAIQSPFRKLVLPLTRRQKERARAEAGKNIVYRPQAIKSPPKGIKLDPMGLLYWHKCLLDSHRGRAEDLREETEEAHRGLLADTDMPGSPVLLPRNYLGPVTPFDFLKEKGQRMVARYSLLTTLRDRLNRAYSRSPRQMLEGVVKNIELGFQGRESWDMREELVAHRERHGKYLDIDDMELYWLDHVCGPSTNVKTQRDALPKLGREFEVFAARVQTLLDNPSRESLLASQERKAGLQPVTRALNAGLRQGDFEFSEEKVDKYSQVLADHGRLGYERTEKGEVLIGRPVCDWHPEHLINWPANDDPWDPQTNIWNRANLPPPENTWDWEAAFGNVGRINGSRRLTKEMLWANAYRVGVELVSLEQRLTDLDGRLSTPHDWDYRALQLQDVAGSWGSRFRRAGGGRGPPVSYASVVKAGDPGKWKEGMTEEEAFEVVRKGIVDELSEAGSTLWPSRPRFGTVKGKDVMTLHRDRVWDWARPEVVGRKKQFFSVNRWPVHLQSKDRQTEAELSRARENLEKERRAAEEAAELERIDARARPTPEEVGKAQMRDMLSVPYHEGPDQRRQFFPGQTEYWGGDTPSQTQAIKAHMRRIIHDELGINDGKAPRGTGWFSREPIEVPRSRGYNDDDGDDSTIKLPEVNPEDVPRSVPARPITPQQASSASGGARESRPAPPTSPPRDIHRRVPLFPPRYPAGQERQGQRRVHFDDEDEPVEEVEE
ncbi:hypothetical protein EsH8_VII_000471 [Colletotrichum jinshuiense]